MRTWPKHPVIYEINTWVWLDELGQKKAGSRFSASPARSNHVGAL